MDNDEINVFGLKIGIFKLTSFQLNIIAFFLSIIPLILTSWILFLKDPPVWLDEGLFLDMTKSLVTSGRIATNLFGEAIPGLEQHAYWYPPIYFQFLSVWIQVFKTSIESVRAFSFFIALLSLIIFFLITRLLFSELKFTVIGMLMLTFDIWFSGASRFGRMDMLCFFFQIITLLLFLLALQHNRLLYWWGVGFFAGLAFLTHPLGIIISLIMVLYLAIIAKKKYKSNALLLFVITFFSLIFLWLYSMKDSFGLFINLLYLQILRKLSMTPYVIILFRHYFFYRVYVILFGIILFLLIQKVLIQKKSIDVLIIIGVIVSGVVITFSKEMWYLLYFQPYITLALLSILSWLIKNKFKFVKFCGVFIIASYFIIHGLFYLTILKDVKINLYDYHLFTRTIRNRLPKRATIFLASFPDPYMDLKDDKNLTLYEFPTVPVTDDAYKKLLDSSEYILLSGWIPDRRVENYIAKNKTKEIIIHHPNGYKTIIIQLKPIKDRGV